MLDNPGAFHLHLTGFGLNLLSGTYEAPCMIVVDDENWWGEWGHEIAGNWETTSIDCYSSADPESNKALVLDPRWSNEGLFSLIEGFRALLAIDMSGRISDATAVTALDSVGWPWCRPEALGMWVTLRVENAGVAPGGAARWLQASLAWVVTAPGRTQPWPTGLHEPQP